MATVTTLNATPVSFPEYRPVIHNDKPYEAPAQANRSFDPKRDLEFNEMPKITKMADLGYSESQGVSPHAVSEPFRIFSKEAVHRMREEILQDKVWEEFRYRSNIAPCQLRGYCAKYAPFIWEAWHSPETLAIVSKIAGVELVPAIDLDIGHINFSVKSQEQTKEELAAFEKEKKMHDDDEGIHGCPWEDEKPIVGWHRDSYPFVCVLMLSDCKDMVGGETALQTATGDVLKVRGPDMGCGVILQGRYITHQALRVLGAQERITMVTSFRPKNPHIRDDTVLDTVRGISDLSTLYFEYSEYRLEMLEARIRSKLDDIRKKRRVGKTFDTKGIKDFLSVQAKFCEQTDKEIVPEDLVVKGYLPPPPEEWEDDKIAE